MSHGSIWHRWIRGASWTWINERYRDILPPDFAASVMNLEVSDRFHAKQGRSTARVIFHRPDHPPTSGEGPGHEPRLAAYLKRQYRLPWTARAAATLDPAGRHSPAASEWAHLETSRTLGIDVPEVIAAGERIGPHGQLTGFLLVAELTGCVALNEILPDLARRLDPLAFASLKRRVIAEVARIAATLHAARLFHRDLYLCHFFLDVKRLEERAHSPRLALIDLHRLHSSRLATAWMRWKDLGQLLYSTYGVDGIDDRDRLRFWRLYRRRCPITLAELQARVVKFRAARYRAHNRKPR